MIDFHCHISTPSARMPEAEGDYYQTVKPLATSGPWMNLIWAETIETMAESWRTPAALRQYQQMAPVIYSEMTRRMLMTTANKLTIEMARHHVRQAIVVAIDPYVPTDEVVATCIATKDILLPFGSVDPWSTNWREKLEKTLASPIAGFKIHNSLQRISYNDPRFKDILRVIAERRPGLPIYMHTGDYPIYKPLDMDWAKSLSPVLSEFETFAFVCGHCGWNRPQAALRLARRHKNLWLETSWQPPKVIRKLCDALGPERLLLGSDFPLFSMRRAIRNCHMVLGPKEFELVSEENARTLLERGRNHHAA
ncbi:MAG TPA: amidohydrolase family protein [Capsulimonadaceae bacterium]|nr:amidohydrolase family protein [Capsulimonadaceae bacterium]